MAVRRALRGSGTPFELTEREDAMSGLEALLSGRYDCVLLDFQMPGKDGMGVLREVRIRGVATPVIMLTGQGDEQTAVELMKAGASDYLSKATLEGERLMQSVQQAVRLQRAEEQARVATAALQQRIELEAQLIAIVSHDLRNPLHAIGVCATTLEKTTSLDERQKKVVQRIVNSSARANRLIRDLLDFTQVRLGTGIPVTMREHDVHGLVRQVVEDVALAHPGRRVEVQVRGERLARVDPDRLAQVVQNLVNNAFQHSPPDSSILVLCEGMPDAVRITVQNQNLHGPISEQDLPHLFEPLRRGDGAGGGAGTGSVGLGLFIARSIVTGHGGTLQAVSNAAQGTQFIAHLPRPATSDGDAPAF